MSGGFGVSVTVGQDAERLLWRLLWRVAVRTALWIAALGLGIAAAALATGEIDSFWLGLFAFVLAVHLVGRGLGRVVTRPHRLQRLVWLSLFPAASIPVVWTVYRASGRMWLSVLLAFLTGIVAERVVGRPLAPRIRAERERPWPSGSPLGERRPAGGDVVDGQYRRLG